MDNDVLLILNPHAGKGKIIQELQNILESFTNNGVIPYVFSTQVDPQKTIDVIKQIGPLCKYVVCIGGDGTLNTTISGLMSLPSIIRPALGYIPMGTTNDFARTLGLSPNVTEAIPQIIEGHMLTLDIGAFNTQHFSYIASFGTFTSSSYDTKQEWKNTLGHLAYLLSGVKELTNIKEYFVNLKTEDVDISDNFIFGSVSNATSIGGMVSLDKSLVNLQDGLFEVILVKMPKTLIELKDLVEALIQQRIENSELITILQASEAQFRISEPIAWSLDGEKSETSDYFEIKNKREALEMRITKVKEEGTTDTGYNLSGFRK